MGWRARGGGFLIVLALQIVGQARAQSFKILVPGHSGASCAGCTNGGLACFGLNSCEAGCLDHHLVHHLRAYRYELVLPFVSRTLHGELPVRR
jgi:hypothetical protein